MVLGGLILQIGIFGFFIVVAALFHRRLRQRPTAESKSPGLPWERYMTFLYVASVGITVRNLCRVVEYGMGQEGYLLQKEWPLYLYDFLLMTLTLAVCVNWYDSNIQPHVRTGHIQLGPMS